MNRRKKQTENIPESRLALLSTKEMYEFQLRGLELALTSNEELPMLQSRYNTATPLLSKYLQVCYQAKVSDSASIPEEELRSFEQRYHAAMIKTMEKLKSLPGTSSSSESAKPKTVKEVSLTKLTSKLKPPKLPDFSGDYVSWPTFKQMFESLVHKNQELDPILKFHYLRESVRGNAFEIIKLIDFNATNYDVAFAALSDRYDNQKVLQYQLVKNLLKFNNDLPTRKSENLRARDIELIYNRVKQSLQQFEAANISTTSWDPIVTFIIITNFDNQTLQEWERVSPEKTPPTRAQLLEFLLKRQRVLESLELKDKQPERRGFKRQWDAK